MNVRGERILIFGDSLSHHASDKAPEIWNVDANSNRTSSAPGDLLASMLLEQGAQAVRTNARVSRSAWNFWQREATADLLASDRAWQPTKVVIVLGTNDVGLNQVKDREAFQALKDAYQGMGAEVWAVGPFISSLAVQNVEQVVQTMRSVFGARFIDGRPLSQLAQHSSDGVHYTATGARVLAATLASALLGAKANKVALGMMFGLLGVAGAIGLGVWWLRYRPKQHALAASNDDDDDDEDFGEDSWFERINKKSKARNDEMQRALDANDAVILDANGRKILLIKTPEMSNKAEGSIRVTAFDADGPIGHTTRKSLDEIAKEMVSDWNPASIEAASAADVDAFTSTEKFEEGSKRVAEVQRLNSGLKAAASKPMKLSTKDPATMTAGQVNKELDKISAARSVLTDELIEAGHGHVRVNDIHKLDHPAAREDLRLWKRFSALKIEIALRCGPGAPSRMPAGFKPRRKLDELGSSGV